MATYYQVDPATGEYVPYTGFLNPAATIDVNSQYYQDQLQANPSLAYGYDTNNLPEPPSGLGIATEQTAQTINQESKNNPFYVDANANPQDVYSGLIKKRQQWMDETVKPYEEALFAGMSYDNPNLATDAYNAAIPNIQNNYADAQGVTNRAMQSAGMGFDTTEQKLNARLGKLKQTETISKTANTIRQRLKERDLNTALGAGTPNVTTNAT